MDITEDQKATITEWVGQGEDLGAIQSRLKDELGITLTYVDTRFLIADLELELGGQPEEEQATPAESEGNSNEPAGEEDQDEAEVVDEDPDHESTVSVTIDSLTQPDAMISGRVTFGDGERAAWQVDRMGQLRLDPETEDYRPSAEDIAAFQAELKKAASNQGI